MLVLRGSFRRVLVGCAALLVLGLGMPGHADEGQWMPKQIPQLDPARLRDMGLAMEPRDLWNPEDGGLMRATVNLSGCSAGFVSPRGLLATNHHCAYGAIQANSSVEHDYLRDGFLAATLADELPAKGSTVKVLVSSEDVSEKIRTLAKAQADPAERARAVDRQRAQLVAECEAASAGHRCQVAEFYNGYEYQLLRYLELTDVRLVYAPPSAIGNYGGELDNWMWPRHAGDFSLMRAYVGPDGKPAPYAEDNVPYVPERHLEVGAEGVGPGDFVGILGYPGRTNRYLPAVEVKRQLEQFLPARVALYGEWIEILERRGAADPAVKIKVAAKLRSLANRHKNARGMIDGIRRNGLLSTRQEEDERLAAWAAEQGEDQTGVLDGLRRLSEDRRASFDADFLLDNLSRGAGSLAIAIDLVRRAREQAKPDLERREAYKERATKRLWQRQQGRLRDYDRGVDQALLEVLFRRIEALPPERRFTGFGVADIARALRATKVTDPAFVKEAFDSADAGTLAASRDPMLVLAHELVDALEEHERDGDRQRGERMVLGPRYFEMLKAVRGGPVYPDANGTLRLSVATVQGYSPRDGLVATPQTVVAGQVAKDTGADPFALPPAIKAAAAAAPQTFWADPQLGDVPVDLLANGDTTGGNSGSPVIDGQGRWVGLNFDRVWENIAGDYGYNVERSRNIIVDVRYLLWVLDEVADAGALLDELGVADRRDAPPRKAVPASGGPASGGPTRGPASKGPASKRPVQSAAGTLSSGESATPSDGQGLVGRPLAEAQPERDARGAASASCACRSNGRDRASGLGLLALLGLRRRRR
ncbi:MAG: S46 family peptidase [Myxococcota bacterium]